MKAYIYIDESGRFAEQLMGGAPAVVGGVCSALDDAEWDKVHIDHLAEWNAGKNFMFAYPQHYHCGPLLGRKIAYPAKASPGDLKDFVRSVFRNILSRSAFGVISRNRGNTMVYSPQATYIMNLISALRCTFDKLQTEQGNNIDGVAIVVASRTIKDTVEADYDGRYMERLLEYVAEQLQVGEGPGVDLARRLKGKELLAMTWGVGERNPGLIAADFVCCLSRSKEKIPEKTTLHVCEPSHETLLGDYKIFHERQAKELLRNKYYGSCLDFLCKVFPLANGSPDIGMLLQQLGSEQDAAILEREVPAILAVVQQLIKNRAAAPQMLSCALAISSQLVDLAESRMNNLEAGEGRQRWLGLEIGAIAGLVACHNHTGAVGPQKVAEDKITDLLRLNNAAAGFDPLVRKNFIQDIQVKNFNLLFNDYQFEKVYDMAGDMIADRKKMVGDEGPDELLGQMLGSQGQACAFMGRLDPSWNDEAIKLFRQSQHHFVPGSLFGKMAQNFIVTALWQSGQLIEAAKLLPSVQKWKLRDECMAASICDRLALPNPEKRAFEVVNDLRILAGLIHSGEEVSNMKTVLSMLEAQGRQKGGIHPFEQWFKWMGILYLMVLDASAADECFIQAQEICGKNNFTMNTIGASVTLLRIVLANMRGMTDTAEKLRAEYNSVQDSLRGKSAGYEAYMTSYVVQHGLEDLALTARPKSAGFWAVCTYLPFAYA